MKKRANAPVHFLSRKVPFLGEFNTKTFPLLKFGLRSHFHLICVVVASFCCCWSCSCCHWCCFSRCCCNWRSCCCSFYYCCCFFITLLKILSDMQRCWPPADTVNQSSLCEYGRSQPRQGPFVISPLHQDLVTMLILQSILKISRLVWVRLPVSDCQAFKENCKMNTLIFCSFLDIKEKFDSDSTNQLDVKFFSFLQSFSAFCIPAKGVAWMQTKKLDNVKMNICKHTTMEESHILRQNVI